MVLKAWINILDDTEHQHNTGDFPIQQFPFAVVPHRYRQISDQPLPVGQHTVDSLHNDDDVVRLFVLEIRIVFLLKTKSSKFRLGLYLLRIEIEHHVLTYCAGACIFKDCCSFTKSHCSTHNTWMMFGHIDN